MTETVIEETVTETVEEVTEIEVNEDGSPAVLDDFGVTLWQRAKSQAEELIANQAQVDAYQGNASAMLDRFRESYGEDDWCDDSDRKRAENIEKAASVLLKLEQERDERINAQIETVTADAATAVAPLLEKVTEMRGKVQAAYKYLTGEYGEDATFGLPAIKRASKANGSSSASGSRRIRNLDVYVNGKLATSKDKDGNEKSNLSAAAKAANVETSVMQSAFWQAQGTQDAEKFQPKVEFTVTDGNGVEYAVIASQRA